MSLLVSQSPFSILGLKYDAEKNKQTIRKAFTMASLHCHPDKKPNPFIPRTYYDLVKAAYEWLTGDKPITQFQWYPVVFFPRSDNIGESTVFSIPTTSQFAVCECGDISTEPFRKCKTRGCEQSIQEYFTVCDACKTAIPIYKYDAHFSAHGLCCLCGEITDEDHYRVYHPEAMCPLCPELKSNGHIASHVLDGCSTCDKFNEGDDLGLVHHVRQDHFQCPLCQRECGDDFTEHLSKVHCFKWDESCHECFSENVDHYLRSHQWLRCPYPNCELQIAQGNFWEHATGEHHFRRCTVCPRTEEDFIRHRTHAEAHELADCLVCERTLESHELPLHQVSEHGWLLCTYCNRAEDSKEMLEEHVKEDHRLVHCSECEHQHLEEDIDIHLSEVHGWMNCSWCKNAFTEEDLRKHITESHPPQEACDACSYRGTTYSLKDHKIQKHTWQQCLYCENIEPPEKFQQHIDEHQLTACKECDISFLPEKQRAHMQEKHQFVQCPFCSSFDSLDDMSGHIIRHVGQAWLSSPIPTLGLSTQLGKRKHYGKKCDLCRVRKIKCIFTTNNEKCDQCLEQPLACPGPSRATKRLKTLA